MGKGQAVVNWHKISVIGWPAEKVAECRAELAGKNLACWCKGTPCHADVLLELANAASEQQPEERTRHAN